MELDTIGKKTKRAIVSYLKEINEYRKIEEGILIDSTAMSYQMYKKYLDLAELSMGDPDSRADGLKLHALSAKFYVNYITNLKSLGISAIQRKKLAFIPEEDTEEESIFAKIANARS